MECNRDCFNCVYDDCIQETISKKEFDAQQEMDFEIKKSKHSTEEQKAKSHQYYLEHREKCLEKNKRYYREHKEKFKEYDRIRKQTHPVPYEKRHEYYIRWRDKQRRLKNGD